MAMKWKVQTILKEHLDDTNISTKVEVELERLSDAGWNVHTILDEYSKNPGSRKFIAIICWKDVPANT